MCPRETATAALPFQPGSNGEFAQSLPRSPLSRLTNASLSPPNRAMNLCRIRDRQESPTEYYSRRTSSPHQKLTSARVPLGQTYLLFRLPLSRSFRCPLAFEPKLFGERNTSSHRPPFPAPSGS